MPVITPTITAPSNSLVIKPTTDATDAIKIADKDGNAILTADTVNNTITRVTPVIVLLPESLTFRQKLPVSLLHLLATITQLL